MRKAFIGLVISFFSSLFIAVVVIVFASSSYVVDSINGERIDYESVIGSEAIESAVKKTDTFFSYFDSTIKETEKWFIIEEDEHMKILAEKSQGAGKASYWLKEKFKQMHETAWNMIYQSIQRAYIYLTILPIALFIAGAAVVDGWFVREIKKETLGYTSPIRYNLAFIGAFSLISLMLISLFIPFNIPPTLTFAWVVLLSYSLKVLFSHLLKKL